MGAALGRDQGVDLVDDDGVDAAQAGGGVRGEEQVERLRGGDEDLCRAAAEEGALLLRGVAGADGDLRLVHGDARALGHADDASEGRAEVALHVYGERFERADIDDAAGGGVRGDGGSGGRGEYEAVEAPEEGGERLAAAGGGQDEGV